MSDSINNIKIIFGDEIKNLLENKENEIVGLIQEAYELHHQGESVLPHSIFLKFPKLPKNRIIGLPAFLGGGKNLAGFKWISSFPKNIEKGLDRASAMLILNSMENGRPVAVMESSIISAKRTAASAALAAKHLHKHAKNNTLGVIGCGFIGFETIRFTISQTNIDNIVICDLNKERAISFKKKVEREFGINVSIETSLEKLFQISGIVVLSTTAATPYIDENLKIPNDTIILNISLRDISADVIANSINIVDDFNHVNRSETSIHLATEKYKHNEFCKGHISDLVNNEIDLTGRNKPIIFSPFGLGVLDIILANYCYLESNDKKNGIIIENFYPRAWND